MADFSRIEAEMCAAIHALQAREKSLTPLERLKLMVLRMNLRALRKASRSHDSEAAGGHGAASHCHCDVCRQADWRGGGCTRR
jgi:hypothetical protein